MNDLYTKIWIHAILITKGSRQLITAPLETRLQNFIHDQLLELACPVRIINGMPDHIHLLFLQHPSRSMGEIVKKIKSTSSLWINHNKLCIQKFSWNAGYAAFSVSESQVQRVFDYISNQKDHHLRESLQQEYAHILDLHGVLPSAD
ncbi:MAG: IS200/IS605 family transposase [Chryseolinea sp.]